jgi:hypothetical protein
LRLGDCSAAQGRSGRPGQPAQGRAGRPAEAAHDRGEQAVDNVDNVGDTPAAGCGKIRKCVRCVMTKIRITLIEPANGQECGVCKRTIDVGMLYRVEDVEHATPTELALIVQFFRHSAVRPICFGCGQKILVCLQGCAEQSP